jgi:peptidase A4-like protein
MPASRTRSARAVLVSTSVLVALAFAPAVPVVASGAAPVRSVPQKLVAPPGRASSQSTNWSGYAAFQGGTTFTTVRGRWVQPAATCSSIKTQYASFWIGIDGYNSNSVEQIGTDSDCTGGNNTHPVYYAWFEIFPAPPTNLNLAIHVGDQIAARISSANGRFRLTITNVTTGRTFSTTEKYTPAALSSAEWIAEAPSGCSAHSCHVLPLANFGTVKFTGSYTTGDGHVGTISDPAWHNDRITMVTPGPGSTAKAIPSALNANGSSFSVDWQHV